MTAFDQTDPNDLFAPDETLPEPLPAEPFPYLEAWLAQAKQDRIQPNPNSMYLATVDEQARPSLRTVLCKDMDVATGRVVFFTNYRSRKGLELESAGRAAALFHWDTYDKQVRIEGPVTRSPAAESDAYFRSRHWQSRLGAWSSDQSQPIDSRDELIQRVSDTVERLGLGVEVAQAAMGETDGRSIDIPRPEFWGGFRLWAEQVELWVGGPGRVHDRARWSRTLEPAQIDGVAGFSGGPWTSTRLQPRPSAQTHDPHFMPQPAQTPVWALSRMHSVDPPILCRQRRLGSCPARAASMHRWARTEGRR